MTGLRFLFLVGLPVSLLLAAACGAAVPEQTPTPSPTLTPAPVEEIVWPSLESVEPASATALSEVTVTGRGGYVRMSDGGFDESARSFQLYFDGEPLASNFSCYVNYCQGTFTVPEGADAGSHEVSVEGGARLTLEVVW